MAGVLGAFEVLGRQLVVPAEACLQVLWTRDNRKLVS
jgi:hypothetical protein